MQQTLCFWQRAQTALSATNWQRRRRDLDRSQWPATANPEFRTTRTTNRQNSQAVGGRILLLWRNATVSRIGKAGKKQNRWESLTRSASVWGKAGFGAWREPCLQLHHLLHLHLCLAVLYPSSGGEHAGLTSVTTLLCRAASTMDRRANCRCSESCYQAIRLGGGNAHSIATEASSKISLPSLQHILWLEHYAL